MGKLYPERLEFNDGEAIDIHPDGPDQVMLVAKDKSRAVHITLNRDWTLQLGRRLVEIGDKLEP